VTDELINEMSDSEARQLVNDIANLFNIGENVRNAAVLLVNIKNASRRSDCLSKIESYHTVFDTDDDSGEYEEALLNWGESPEKYIETYKDMIVDMRQ